MAPPGIFVVLQDSNSNIFMKIMVRTLACLAPDEN